MRMKSLYIAAAVLCVAACSKSSGNGATGANTTGTSGDTPTGNGYGGTNNDPAPTTANTVNANPSLDYNPATLTVPVGTTVSFVFGSVAHTVNFPNAGSPANIPATSNATVTRTFTAAGSYGYFCTIHTYMTGTIVVQ